MRASQVPYTTYLDKCCGKVFFCHQNVSTRLGCTHISIKWMWWWEFMQTFTWTEMLLSGCAWLPVTFPPCRAGSVRSGSSAGWPDPHGTRSPDPEHTQKCSEWIWRHMWTAVLVLSSRRSWWITFLSQFTSCNVHMEAASKKCSLSGNTFLRVLGPH